MKTLIIILCISFFSWIGWWLGGSFGLMIGYLTSFAGSGGSFGLMIGYLTSFAGSFIGVYVGVRINREYMS
jgi:hypothetical protein